MPAARAWIALDGHWPTEPLPWAALSGQLQAVFTARLLLSLPGLTTPPWHGHQLVGARRARNGQHELLHFGAPRRSQVFQGVRAAHQRQLHTPEPDRGFGARPCLTGQ